MRALSWWLSLGDLEIGNNSVRDKILYRADEFAKANADTAIVFGAFQMGFFALLGCTALVLASNGGCFA